MPALLALVGCMGPVDETRITELRVVSIATDPAQTTPGAPFALTVTVADPLAEGGDLLVWSCAPDELVEKLAITEQCAARTAPLDAEQITFDWASLAPLPIWAMACAPGLCGDLAAIGPAALADPPAWLQTLPLTGVSAGFRSSPVAIDPKAPPATNPKVLTVPEGPVPADAEVGSSLTFVAQGATTAFGYATSGGFGAASYDVSEEGEVTLTWFADPEASEPARLYVVFEDGNGGVAVWLGDGATPGL